MPPAKFQIPYLIPFFLIFITFSQCGSQSHNSSSSPQSNKVIPNPERKYFSNLIVTYDTSTQLRFTEAVRSIYEDSQGNYWFGSWSEGVCKFDGVTLTYFTHLNGLSNNQVRTIQEDQQGNIWFATGQGITKYDGEKMTVEADPMNLDTNLFNQSNWELSENDLWFNLDSDWGEGKIKGLCRYDNQKLSFLKFPDEVLNNKLFRHTSTVTGISKGKNNQIWFSNYEGVFGFNGTDFQFFKDLDYPYHVRSILEDSKGNLWIGNNGIGVLLFDGEMMINFSKKHKLDNPEYYNSGTVQYKPGLLARVFSMAEDIKGNIWFGTVDAGAWKYDGKKLTNYTEKDGLTSLEIMEIYSDKKGKLWFGMGDGSVCQFNGSSFDKIF